MTRVSNMMMVWKRCYLYIIKCHSIYHAFQKLENQLLFQVTFLMILLKYQVKRRNLSRNLIDAFEKIILLYLYLNFMKSSQFARSCNKNLQVVICQLWSLMNKKRKAHVILTLLQFWEISHISPQKNMPNWGPETLHTLTTGSRKLLRTPKSVSTPPIFNNRDRQIKKNNFCIVLYERGGCEVYFILSKGEVNSTSSPRTWTKGIRRIWHSTHLTTKGTVKKKKNYNKMFMACHVQYNAADWMRRKKRHSKL